MGQSEEIAMTSIFVVLTLVGVAMAFAIVFLFFIFQKRKSQLIKTQQLNQQQFEKEIAEAQIEIREQTLRNISWELHDNIGQLLTLAKIQLNHVEEDPNAIEEVGNTLSTGLKELRALSKLINPEALNRIDLHEAIDLEIQRFNRLKFIKADLQIVGEIRRLDKKVAIVIFRILQEFFANTIKHAKASSLQVQLTYLDDSLQIMATDNGKGFDTSVIHEGIGIGNMKYRAKLVGAELNIHSSLNTGSTLNLNYFFNHI